MEKYVISIDSLSERDLNFLHQALLRETDNTGGNNIVATDKSSGSKQTPLDGTHKHLTNVESNVQLGGSCSSQLSSDSQQVSLNNEEIKEPSSKRVKFHVSQQNAIEKTVTVQSEAEIEPKRFICELCKREFPKAQNLRQHMITHSGEKPFQCEICSEVFTQCSNLYRHLDMHKERNIQCTVCKKKFGSERQLKRHLPSHKQERTHKCDICDKYFKEGAHLRAHQKVHTSVMEKCDECGKEVKAHYMKIHLRKHAENRAREYSFS